VRRSDIDALHARLNEVEARLALATTPNTTTTPDVIVVNMVSKTTGGTTARNARGQAIGFLTPMCIVISVGTAIQEVCREHYGQIAGFEAEQNRSLLDAGEEVMACWKTAQIGGRLPDCWR